MAGTKAGWFIEVPSHSLAVSVAHVGDTVAGQSGTISVSADTVFLQQNKIGDGRAVGLLSTGTGRIGPEKVLDIIALAEQPAEPDMEMVDQVATAGGENSIAGPNFVGPEIDTYTSPSSSIDVVVSQKIELFHGEDIILSTFGLFEDRLKSDASYVSASLPEWMFLDQRSGDLMGTVPIHKWDNTELEISIYAVDTKGNSAKAIIPVECFAQKFPAGEDLRDYTFCEGSLVSIPTIGMFVDFGLDVSNLEFFGEGLPEGLMVDKADGLVKGQLVKGSAADAPNNIVITASDGTGAGNGISMQFQLDVTENEHLPHSLNVPASFDAILNLYKMNRESAQILAGGIVGGNLDTADSFSVQKMPLNGNNILDDVDHSSIPDVHLFTPDRYLYLQVRNQDNEKSFEYSYDIQLTDQQELPDWIRCSPDGFVEIKCPQIVDTLILN